jgi:hypothetical protein
MNELAKKVFDEKLKKELYRFGITVKYMARSDCHDLMSLKLALILITYLVLGLTMTVHQKNSIS